MMTSKAQSPPLSDLVPTVPPDAFRNLMASFPSGVAVVTATDLESQPFGMTCTAVSSVSDDPAMLLVCILRTSRTLTALRETGTFAVNLLNHHAKPIAELFSKGNTDRFAQVRWSSDPSHGGPHLTEEAHTVADCRVIKTVPMADHIVIFGEVFKVTLLVKECPQPLVYGLRNYWTLGH